MCWTRNCRCYSSECMEPCAFANLPAVDVRRLVREERADFTAFSRRCRRSNGRRRRCVRAGGCVMWLRTTSRAGSGPAGSTPPTLARYDRHNPEQLLALLTDHLQPRGLPAALGGRVALVEGLIHHQDIRRPLGLPRTIPPERLLPAPRTALIAPRRGRVLAYPRDAAGRHRSRLCLRNRAGGPGPGRGAAHGHCRPAQCDGRTVWSGPGQACKPQRQPMTLWRIASARRPCPAKSRLRH